MHQHELQARGGEERGEEGLRLRREETPMRSQGADREGAQVIYTFKCSSGHREELVGSISVGPPASFQGKCGHRMERDWQADAPMIDTSACKDHSSVRPDKQVRSRWDRNKRPETVENEFRQHIGARRKQIRDAGGQRGSLKQTHAVPAHLYHGKIKETGDKNYWSDPKNLSRHNDCKVDG
jgi:hypothetical protein